MKTRQGGQAKKNLLKEKIARMKEALGDINEVAPHTTKSVPECAPGRATTTSGSQSQVLVPVSVTEPNTHFVLRSVNSQHVPFARGDLLARDHLSDPYQLQKDQSWFLTVSFKTHNLRYRKLAISEQIDVCPLRCVTYCRQIWGRG